MDDTLILTYLYKFKALNLLQISKLLRSEVEVTKKLLTSLYRKKLIEKNKHVILGVYYYLTKTGGLIISPLEKIKITHIPKEMDIFLEHRSKTNDFVITLINALKDKGIDSDFALDEHCYKTFNLNGNTLYINPDAQIVYKFRDKQIVVFLELDRGTMELKKIKEKIIRYHNYIKSQEYQIYSEYLPLICFVIDGGKMRVSSISRLILKYFDSNDKDLGIGFLITSLSQTENILETQWLKITDNKYVKLPIEL